jgi:hypothetical protein
MGTQWSQQAQEGQDSNDADDARPGRCRSADTSPIVSVAGHVSMDAGV